MSKKQTIAAVSELEKPTSLGLAKRLSEGGFILLLMVAFFILLSLSTYKISDPGFIHGELSSHEIANAGGKVGAYLADFLYLIFGYLSYLLPIYFIYLATIILKDFNEFKINHMGLFFFKILGVVFILAGGCGLLALEWEGATKLAIDMPGGIVGHWLTFILIYSLNIQGAAILLTGIFLVGITWLTGLSWIQIVEITGWASVTVSLILWRGFLASFDNIKNVFNRKENQNQNTEKPEIVITRKRKQNIKPQEVVNEEPSNNFNFNNDNVSENKIVTTKSLITKVNVTGTLPAVDLLDTSTKSEPLGGYSHQELEQLSREVEQHLLDFGIQADVVAVHPGPVITRFELQLAAGVKANKLTALSKDLARSLSVTSVRVVEIIPGKTVVGIELPNQNRAMVRFSEVLNSEVYQEAASPLTLALGVDIAGLPMTVDLAKMPHLLVAGTTGSGKSVGINAMILSLLFKATPEQVRLIMIDPKMLELSVYEGIPHLLAPVVTDMKEAASALRWCVGEMERRYRLMASLGVRNLVGFNNKIKEALGRDEPITDPLWTPDSIDAQAPILTPLPYVVVIIDELADMMMVVGKKVEQLIARIAQKARAAGIHLILATQRPSVDVLTGLIKSNIPTRISFQVSSKIDSRTILDQQGAEQLLGHGDMLFLSPGAGTPLRVHGAFVDDKEVHNVANDWRMRGNPEYIEDITQNNIDPFESADETQNCEDSDPLYDQVVEFVIETRKTSISSIQRRFKIGYNRAARLVEEMERTGILGPLDGGVRDVMVSSSNYGE